jgi:hypothetical protein
MPLVLITVGIILMVKGKLLFQTKLLTIHLAQFMEMRTGSEQKIKLKEMQHLSSNLHLYRRSQEPVRLDVK